MCDRPITAAECTLDELRSFCRASLVVAARSNDGEGWKLSEGKLDQKTRISSSLDGLLAEL